MRSETLKLKLTDGTVKGLQWNGEARRVFDTECAGFHVRVYGAGPAQRSYGFQANIQGKPKLKTLGTVGVMPCETARKLASDMRNEIAQGRNPFDAADKAKGAWTLGDAMTYFVDVHAKARKLDTDYVKDSQGMFRNHLKQWETVKIKDITRDDVVNLHSSRSATQRRANAVLSLLSVLFSLAIEKGHASVNPCSKVDRFPEGSRERILSNNEYQTLVTYLRGHKNKEAATFVFTVLLMGQRPKAVSLMKWIDVDLAHRTWRQPASTTKTKTIERLPLPPSVVEMLSKLQRRSEWVFPAPEDASQRRTDRCRAFWRHTTIACGLAMVEGENVKGKKAKRLNMYALRHSFGSHAVQNGVTLYEVGTFMGHKNSQTTRRYAHLADGHLRKIAELHEQRQKAVEVSPPLTHGKMTWLVDLVPAGDGKMRFVSKDGATELPIDPASVPKAPDPFGGAQSGEITDPILNTIFDNKVGINAPED